MNFKTRRIKLEKLRNESVKLDFQEKLNKKLTGTDETVKGEIERVWRHLKGALMVAATELCSTAGLGCGK